MHFNLLDAQTAFVPLAPLAVTEREAISATNSGTRVAGRQAKAIRQALILARVRMASQYSTDPNLARLGGCASACLTGPKTLRLAFKATRDDVLEAFPAIANIADKSADGKVTIQVDAAAENRFDPSKVRNAVEVPLDKADVERI